MSGSTVHTPMHSVELIPGSSPKRNVTIGEGSMYPILLVKPSTGTYGNGVGLAAANEGDDNDDEADIEQLEIEAARTSTAYDITTVYTTGDPAIAIKHMPGKGYWLKGSSLTASKGDKLIPTSSGLVKKALTHTATPLPMHTWSVIKAVTSATYVQGEYKGLVSSFTA